MNKLFSISLVLLIIAVDQLSKWTVLENIFRRELGLGDPMRFMDWLQQAPQRLPDVSLPVWPMFNLTMVWNEGISFGLLQTGGWGLLTIMGLVICAGFFIWMLRASALGEILALALIVGGALGNIFDRIRFGAVADFFDFYWGNWHFPAFNVADSAITAGVVLLILQSLFFAKKSG
ncbi:MAG: signal peptidase II [Proteobacteria bacterium]|nr:signal peptidase II [Pseudomonadota bacterium]